MTTFDPADDLIIVHARLWGADGQERELRLVVDTGAGPTIIAPELLDELGYSARQHGEQVASTRSIAGREQGYILRVKQLECLGMVEQDFRVYAQDLPSGWDIDGLLGLSFLRLLNYEVRSLEGRILVERAVAPAA
ncbi:MAG: retropepsin-like domain-containing protein [Myxococcota bacterium]|nr:retropepsin-like domain-containing protein [Myxococcota bacterium]